MKKVEVQRHSIFMRVCHWSIVITGILLALTGMQLGGLYGIQIVPEQALATHVLIGFVFGALWGLFAYYILTKEWKWISLSRIPYSLKFFWAETKAWFGEGHVEDPRAYDPEKGEYIEKIIPTQVMVWWGYALVALLTGLTGLAMYYPKTFWPIIAICQALAPIFGTENGFALVRALHLFGMYLFAVILIMHVYAVIIFGVLPSMVSGKREEKVAEKTEAK
ncbi:MAG: cytochrome b/b6 domain-containing protein [Archaeoglobaceae archaeon]|nr:cytochrome b/b6 domain-containing protein [Archaeoglobaceae archaeon]HDD36145.1 cytochrome b/b6 domain-containing protein [Archaeoglobus veneficus]